MLQQINRKYIRIGKVFFIVAILYILLSSFVFSTAVVVGDSMFPTIKNDQKIIMNKSSYAFHEPSRGDIVVINLDGKIYIKRIIGLSNETLTIYNQQLYIDNIAYQQTFITDISSFRTHDVETTHIPPGYYYVIGDNRHVSKDSRNSLGFIAEDDIVGQAIFIYKPFSAWKIIK